MRQRLIGLADQLRSSFWFLPSVLLLSAAVLAWAALAADAALDITWGGALYNGGPEGARTLLGTIAGSMVTVGTTVFSLTMVALTLTSNQFGPRLLTNFVRDRGNQVTIGLFLAVFLYSLLVLRAVRDRPGGVPDLAVSLALVLAVVALIGLVYFIHHIASSIQVMNLVQLLADDLRSGLDSTVPERDADPEAEARARTGGPRPAADGQRVDARASGYVLYLDREGFVGRASDRDLVIELLVRPGKFVIEGTPLARAWTASGGAADPDDCDDLADLVGLGPQRSLVQDVEFPIRQIVELGVRALSPGINDPTTAVACVNQLSVGLCQVADRPMPPSVLTDDEGRARVRQDDPLTFPRLVGVSFDEVRQMAGAHVVVYLHLLEALTSVAGCTQRTDRLEVVRRQGELVWERAQQAVAQAADLEAVRERHEALQAATGRS